jgi:hypothetical protein
MRATCPAHLILLALITLTVLGEEYKPRSSYYDDNDYSNLIPLSECLPTAKACTRRALKQTRNKTIKITIK